MSHAPLGHFVLVAHVSNPCGDLMTGVVKTCGPAARTISGVVTFLRSGNVLRLTDTHEALVHEDSLISNIVNDEPETVTVAWGKLTAPTRDLPTRPGEYWMIPRKGVFGARDHLGPQWMMMRVFEFDGGLAVESEDSIPIDLSSFEWFYGPLTPPAVPEEGVS